MAITPILTAFITEKRLRPISGTTTISTRRAVQQSPPGNEDLAGRSEMHVVLKTVPEVADDGII